MAESFAIEGGRYHLAEALFLHYKRQIRCEHCKGNHGQPGFIKDQAGKTTAVSLARR